LREAIPSIGSSAEAISVALIVALTTYLSLVIGELVPKRLALRYPEAVSKLIAPPMQVLSKVATPLVWLLTGSTNFLARLLGVRPDEDSTVTEAEILSMIREGIGAGIFEKNEEVMVEGVMRLDDQSVASALTPRNDVIWLPLDASEEKIRETVSKYAYSVYPVAEDDLDEVIGIVRSKDLLVQMLNGENFDLKSIMLSPLIVPETVPISDVFAQFKQTGMHTAVALDEYGGVAGIIRMHDLIEQIVGDLDGGPHATEEAEAIQRQDGSWLVNGQIRLQELAHIFPQFKVPEDEEREYHTLAGFIMARTGDVPSTSDHIAYNDLNFEIVDMDGVSIDKVLITQQPE
jgi:putative hemolysin